MNAEQAICFMANNTRQKKCISLFEVRQPQRFNRNGRTTQKERYDCKNSKGEIMNAEQIKNSLQTMELHLCKTHNLVDETGRKVSTFGKAADTAQTELAIAEYESYKVHIIEGIQKELNTLALAAFADAKNKALYWKYQAKSEEYKEAGLI